MSEWLGVDVLQCCDETGEAAVHGLLDDWGLHCAWQTVLGAASGAAALYRCTANHAVSAGAETGTGHLKWLGMVSAWAAIVHVHQPAPPCSSLLLSCSAWHSNGGSPHCLPARTAGLRCSVLSLVRLFRQHFHA